MHSLNRHLADFFHVLCLGARCFPATSRWAICLNAGAVLAACLMAAPARAGEVYSHHSPKEDYNDYSRASAKEIMLRNQANAMDRQTVAALASGGGVVGNDVGSYILATPLVPVTFLAMLTGKGIQSLNAKWDEASIKRAGKKIGRKIRASDKEWAEYVADMQEDVDHRRIIRLGYDHGAAMREAVIALQANDFNGYMTALRRGIDIHDAKAAALYAYELSLRPEKHEELGEFSKRHCKMARSRLYWNNGYDRIASVMCPYYVVYGAALSYSDNIGEWKDKSIQGLYGIPREEADAFFLTPAYYRLWAYLSFTNTIEYIRDPLYCMNQYGRDKSKDECTEYIKRDTQKKLNEYWKTIDALACVRCGALWYDMIHPHLNDGGEPAWFDVKAALANGEPTPDEIGELILSASSHEGGRKHTLPAIREWAVSNNKATLLTGAALYLESRGRKVDAVTWYGYAADAGDTLAMRNLALMLDKGVDGATDHPRAVALLEKASTAGDLTARATLGFRLAAGDNVAADPARGLALLTQASADPHGAYLLGRAHALGVGTAKDPGKARPLLEQASRSGHAGAAELLKQL